MTLELFFLYRQGRVPQRSTMNQVSFYLQEDLDQEFYISMTPVVTAFWQSVKTLARGKFL